jgi:acyl carrier protein
MRDALINLAGRGHVDAPELNIRNQLRRFVVDNFLLGQENASLTDGESFLAHDLVDSTGVLELVAFLEKHYGVDVLDEDLVPENLDSIDNLVTFLKRKLPSSI